MKKENNITEVVFILDRSGSMHGFEGDTIGGFNSTIEKQKEIEGTVYVSTVLFSNDSSVVHDRVTIDKIKPMTSKDYVVGGSTALLDAIGDSVKHISTIHKYARPDDVPAQTIFVIITDGMENSSHKYDSRTVKKMIEEKTKESGWEFIFLAANIDAVETAGSIGICEERAVGYTQSAAGFKANYCAVSDAIKTVRKRKSLDDNKWRRSLDNSK